MDWPSVSVIVISRARPDALARCLTAVAQLDYPEAELIVAGCAEAMGRVAARPDAARIKTVRVEAANVSEARNAGLALAAGELVAFVDDDAVPEPSWLRHLVQPFRDPAVAAAGGCVVGRNGISVQWGAGRIDAAGETAPLVLDGTATQILTPTPDLAIKTEGTNMAFRRHVLAEMGGFDPGFHYYLDETDVNWRLGRAGHLTAWVPLARVHHGFAASALRRSDRTPRDLTQIGASKALFLRKHAPEHLRAPALNAFRRGQRLRLMRLMQSGALGPDDVLAQLRSLERGLTEGAGRTLAAPVHIPKAPEGLRPFPMRPGARHEILGGWAWQRAVLDSQARHVVDAGHTATVLRFSPTALFHRLSFAEAGHWVQTGGVWGRSLRNQPLVRLSTLRARLRAERDRLRRTMAFVPEQGQ